MRCDHGAVTTATSDAPTRHWQRPAPVQQGRIVGGVAAGIADELGVEPFVIRLAFVVLATAGGAGIILYGVAWLASLLPGGPDTAVVERSPKGADETQRLLGIGLVVFGMLSFLRWLDVAFIDSLVWPVALVGAGVAVAHVQGVDLSATTDRLVGAEADRSAFLVRVAAGALLVAAGIVFAVTLNFSWRRAWDTLLVVAVVVAGIVLVLGPWVSALVNDLTAERRARIRANERAEVAAHLHDSVLQTLSLIQRRADDPQVVNLARRQERELRSWLYGRRTDHGDRSFRERLVAELADVEDLHAVPVEVVVVGDGALDEPRQAILAATREAVTNAAVHSGAGRVDVYAEVDGARTAVFVRDTGCGFDPGSVADDRRGIADSIRGRVQRVGGEVSVMSQPGEGTEVELSVESEAP